MSPWTYWTLDDIPWDNFDPAAVDPDTVTLFKAVGLAPRGRPQQWSVGLPWRLLRLRARQLAAVG